MSDEKKYRYQLNAKARHNMMCVLSEEKMSKVHAMISAKEMWDTLALSHEGFKEVKRNMLTLFRHQYEMCSTNHKTIQSMITSLQVILNSLRSLGASVSQ